MGVNGKDCDRTWLIEKVQLVCVGRKFWLNIQAYHQPLWGIAGEKRTGVWISIRISSFLTGINQWATKTIGEIGAWELKD